MNILVIGNGFDLAHGLPTRYTDFLEFTEEFMKCYQKKDAIDWVHYDTSHEINKYLKKMFSARYADEHGHISIEKEITQKLIEELKDCIENNAWIKYFLDICENQIKNGKDGWIDFEKEISDIIQLLDKNMHSEKCNFYEDKKALVDIFSSNKYQSFGTLLRTQLNIDKISYQEIRDKLLDDLNRLIRAFEIYLCEYIEKIDCKLISPDIQRILPKESMKINGIPVYDIYVLSFNYTNTYQRLYFNKIEGYEYLEKNIDHIHGKANIDNTIESNNMVLGIDEYLPKKRKNKNIEFIAFKKYYQRIYKRTGCKYKKWIDCIKKAYEDFLQMGEARVRRNVATEFPQHNLYIFGHSLDVTDKDILRDIILNDNVYTTIFYHDKDTMGQQIANLVKVIGQDELIRRTGGNTKTIEFKLQQPMVPISK